MTSAVARAFRARARLAARGLRARVALGSLVLLSGCAGESAVERGYDDYVALGRYVPPGAYAAFLRGSIAEASGRPADALAAYDDALRGDRSGPEIWTRIAALRCAASPHDARADEALAKAMTLDADRAQTWTVKAACALARGDAAGAAVAARRATELDASADRANALLVRVAPLTLASASASAVASAPALARPPLAKARETLLALTTTAGDPVVAWDALAAWAEAHGDVALWGYAYEGLVKADPERRESAARAAETLAGLGEIGTARAVAAAAADVTEAPLAGIHDALAARLAVDEAIAQDDAPLVRQRATRVRVTLEEAAARALLVGNVALARRLASPVALADESDLGSRLVLAASDRHDVLAALSVDRRGAPPVSWATWAALRVALRAGVANADAALASVAHEPRVAGDTLGK